MEMAKLEIEYDTARMMLTLTARYAVAETNQNERLNAYSQKQRLYRISGTALHN